MIVSDGSFRLCETINPGDESWAWFRGGDPGVNLKSLNNIEVGVKYFTWYLPWNCRKDRYLSLILEGDNQAGVSRIFTLNLEDFESGVSNIWKKDISRIDLVPIDMRSGRRRMLSEWRYSGHQYSSSENHRQWEDASGVRDSRCVGLWAMKLDFGGSAKIRCYGQSSRKHRTSNGIF
jgi:hypothetical protein